MGTDETKSPIDVLIELLDKKNVEMKTDLNISQIKILFQVKWFTEILKEDNKDKDPFTIFSDVIDYFLQLMVSYKRQSRKESIKGISEVKRELLDSFMPIGGLK